MPEVEVSFGAGTSISATATPTAISVALGGRDAFSVARDSGKSVLVSLAEKLQSIGLAAIAGIGGTETPPKVSQDTIDALEATATVWGAGTFVAGDLVSHNDVFWEARIGHTTAGGSVADEPGVGVAWVKYWKPWVVEGYHYTRFRTPLDDYAGGSVVLSNPSSIRDWSPAIDYLLGEVYSSGAYGGSGNAAYLDGVPHADPVAWSSGVGYTAAQFRSRSGVWYKCIANHTSASSNAPGTGASWEDYWIVWPYDFQNSLVLYLSPGTYKVSAGIRQPPSCPIVGLDPYRRFGVSIEPSSTWSWDDGWLIHGCLRNGNNATSCFWTSIIGVKLDLDSTANGIYYCASQGSVIDMVNLENGAGQAGILVGTNADDIRWGTVVFRDSPGGWLKYCIYGKGTVKGWAGGPITTTDCAVGLFLEDPSGIDLHVESENTKLLAILGDPTQDTSSYPAYNGGGVTYQPGDLCSQSGGYYMCYRYIGTSTTATGPTGASGSDYWYEVPGSGDGSCFGVALRGLIRWRNDDRKTLARIKGNQARVAFQYFGKLTLQSSASTPTATHVLFQTTAGSGNKDIWQIPILPRDELSHGLDDVGCDFSMEDAFRNTHRWVSYAGGAQAYAKEVDGYLVSDDNPAQYTGDRSDTVSLARGLYRVRIIGTTWGTGDYTLQDEDGTAVSGFDAVTADRVRYMYATGGVYTSIVANSTGGEEIDVYFEPVAV